MVKTEIRDFNNYIIAYVELDERTGDKTLRDFYNKILGYYRKSRNVSTNFAGKVLGYGDFTVAMILQYERMNLDI